MTQPPTTMLAQQLVIKIIILTLPLANAFAHLPQMVAPLVKSGMTMFALASAVQKTAQTTFTGATKIVTAYASP